MTVYPDLAFLLGLVLHGAVFRLSLVLLDLRRPRWQFLLSSLLGGLSSALVLLPQIPVFLPLMMGMGISVFLFRGKSVRGTVFNLFTGFGVLFLYLGLFLVFSGMIFGLSLDFAEPGGYFLLPFLKSIFVAFLSYCVGTFFLRIRKKRVSRPQCCDCQLRIEGKTVPFRAYIDTGNFLSDPVSGLPVVILEFFRLRQVLGSDFPPPMSYEFAARFGPRAKVIPYRSVSGEGRMLSAFIPEAFSVNGIPRNAIIAVSDRPLEVRGRFSGIIGPDLIGGE